MASSSSSYWSYIRISFAILFLSAVLSAALSLICFISKLKKAGFAAFLLVYALPLGRAYSRAEAYYMSLGLVCEMGLCVLTYVDSELFMSFLLSLSSLWPLFCSMIFDTTVSIINNSIKGKVYNRNCYNYTY